MPDFEKPFISDSAAIKSPLYIRYGLPVLLTVFATLLKIALTTYFGYKTPFLLYFGVVIITARYFGRKPAILVVVLSAIAVNVFFMYPFNTLMLDKDSLFQILLFVLESLLIVGFSTALLKANVVIDEKDVRFKTLIEKSSEGIVTIDINGKFLYCSPSIQNILGYTDQEFLTLPSWELLKEDEALEVREKFFRYLAHPGKALTVQHQMRHKNGEWIWIESKMTNLLGEPPINAIIANFTDITARVLNEKLRDDFISVASHELKTPLTSLKAYTQVLQHRFKNSTDETSVNIINKTEQQVNKVIQMVTSLLDVTNLQQNKLSLNMRLFDLNALITDITETTRQTTAKHKIVTKLVAIPNVLGDKERIAQVITNMLSNAIKYSDDADLVEITSRIEKGQVVVSVKDYGIGIPEKDIDKIFVRFYRVSEAKQKFQGLGLGLYICAQIIDQHDGSIGVNSVEGVGSTFWFSLPVKQ